MKNILLIFLIVLFHEFGHIFFIKYFHYSIVSIEILPFGGLTKTSKFLNTPILHDLIIYLGGVTFQIFLSFFFFILNKQNIIYSSTYQMFCTYNTWIFFFNLLPMRPLDGGEILRLLLEKKLPFKKAQIYANVFSFFVLSCFFFLNIHYKFNNYLICSFLLFKLYDLIKNQRMLLNRFFLERFLYNFPYQKIKHENHKNLCLLKKDTWHYFKEGDKVISEKELLRRKFDIHHFF